MHVYGTYKITTCSYPLIVVGFTDLESWFDCIVYRREWICRILYWIFDTLIRYCRCYDIDFSLKTIISDDSLAISAAINHTFSNSRRVHSWAHTWRLIEIFLKPLDALGKEIGSDIHSIQALSRKDLFNEGLRLFKSKWEPLRRTSGFVDSFFKL